MLEAKVWTTILMLEFCKIYYYLIVNNKNNAEHSFSFIIRNFVEVKN